MIIKHQDVGASRGGAEAQVTLMHHLLQQEIFKQKCTIYTIEIE
jgi:hypothetical protein